MKLDLINEKVYNEKNEKLVRKLIINQFLVKDKWYRKPLINTCIEQLQLSEQIKSDKSYNSLFTKCKSLIGSVITSMINEGYLYLNQELLTEIIIPNTVTTIGRNAFEDCTNLTKIIIPNSVEVIEQEAFINCKKLTIYCETKSEPSKWHPIWNNDELPVVWGYTG